MNLYDIAIARKLSGGGGGGSSDFSTAEVVIEQGFSPKMTMYLPICYETSRTSFAVAVQIEASDTVTAILYKGILVASPNLEEGANVSVSGNCEYNSEWQQFVITGDCTITIS